MEEKLRQKLKRNCGTMLASMAVLVGIAFFLLMGTLLTSTGVIQMIEMKEEKELKVLLAAILFFLGSIVASIVTLRPYLLDYRAMQKHDYRVIEAVFVRYDYQKTGDEDSTLREIPIFCDAVTREMLTFDLDEELEQDADYRIAYLPQSRTAVVERIET